MSHFDDVDALVWAGPAGVLGIVAAAIAIGWAIWADGKSADLCESLHEQYVDSREGYTLCADDAGVVHQR